MAITKKTRHDHCTVYVKMESHGPHLASLHCQEHQMLVQWLNAQDLIELNQLGVPVEIKLRRFQ